MSRVSKKAQFEAFNKQKNCFSDWQDHQVNLESWRDKSKLLMLEMGAGTAKISQHFSMQRASWQVIAIDKKSDRLYKLARQNSSENLAFLQTDIAKLRQVIDLTNQVDLLWLPFPDPYPKMRQAKHRLLHPYYLQLYSQYLKTKALLRFKTDHKQLFEYAISNLNHQKDFKINCIEEDLSQGNYDNYSNDVQILTDYEIKFLNVNKPIFYLEAMKL